MSKSGSIQSTTCKISPTAKVHFFECKVYFQCMKNKPRALHLQNSVNGRFKASPKTLLIYCGMPGSPCLSKTGLMLARILFFKWSVHYRSLVHLSSLPGAKAVRQRPPLADTRQYVNIMHEMWSSDRESRPPWYRTMGLWCFNTNAYGNETAFHWMELMINCSYLMCN